MRTERNYKEFKYSVFWTAEFEVNPQEGCKHFLIRPPAVHLSGHAGASADTAPTAPAKAAGCPADGPGRSGCCIQ